MSLAEVHTYFDGVSSEGGWRARRRRGSEEIQNVKVGEDDVDEVSPGVLHVYVRAAPRLAV
jgi:hypothetical protein